MAEIRHLENRPEVELQYGGRLFFQTGNSSYLSRGFSYKYEIWFAERN